MRLTPRIVTEPASPIGTAYALIDPALLGAAPPTDLLDLSQAAPAYPPAPSVVEHVVAIARDPRGAAYAAQAGLAHLREAFAAELAADYAGAVHPEHVVVTAGCNQAFCLVSSVLADPGDEVVVPLPYYFNHDMWLRMTGVVPVYLEPGPDLVPTAAAAAELITPRTRAIVLVTPNNPTGVTVGPAEIAAFAALAREHGTALILDETYRSFRDRELPTPAAPPPPTPSQSVPTPPAPPPAHDLFADPAWSDTVVSLHSFSKDLAIPGYRVGAVVASAALNREVLKLLDCVMIGAPRVGQEAAWAGLTTAREWRTERAAEIATRRRGLSDALADGPGGFALLACGGFFGWLRHPFADRPTADVVRALAHEHGVLVLPGTAFLPEDRRMVRVSVGRLDDAGLHRLVGALEAVARP